MAYEMQNITGAPEKKNKLRPGSSLRREEKRSGAGEKKTNTAGHKSRRINVSISSVVWDIRSLD